MKLHKKTLQTFPIAVAIQAFSSPSSGVHVKEGDRATDSQIAAEARTNWPHTTDTLTSLIGALSSQDSNSFEQTMDLGPDSWGPDEDDRFDELVTKEALTTITRPELSELNALQKVRRKLVNPPLSEEMATRLKREKLDRELLEVLKRNVRFQPFSTNPA